MLKHVGLESGPKKLATTKLSKYRITSY